MIPTLVENSYFLVYLFVNFFLKTLLLWLWLKYNNYSGTVSHTASKQWLRAPHLCIYCLKEDGYCQLCLTRYAAVQINNWLKRISAIKIATVKIICGEQRWMGHKRRHSKAMNNVLHVQRYDKRHLKWLQIVKKSSP